MGTVVHTAWCSCGTIDTICDDDDDYYHSDWFRKTTPMVEAKVVMITSAVINNPPNAIRFCGWWEIHLVWFHSFHRVVFIIVITRLEYIESAHTTNRLYQSVLTTTNCYFVLYSKIDAFVICVTFYITVADTIGNRGVARNHRPSKFVWEAKTTRNWNAMPATTKSQIVRFFYQV